MRRNFIRSMPLLLGLLPSVALVLPAYADDTEIFYGQTTANSAPNIMFILDTSGSMGTVVNSVSTDYDPNTSYTTQGTGSCSGLSGRIFYAQSGNGTPACNGNYFTTSQLKCKQAMTPLGTGGTGKYGPDALIRWGASGNNKYSWNRNLDNNSGDVECLADNGVDGNLTTTNPYPTNASPNSSTAVWVSSSNSSYWSGGQQRSYILFNANYIVWYNQFRTVATSTRMSIMKDAATDLLNSMTGVNVGLMRYDSNASGGMVAYPVSPIETARSSIISALNSYSAGGNTPLSETLYESYLYFKGGTVDFGQNSSPFHSVDGSRVGGTSTSTTYDSPSDYSCQKNAIVYLTDGLPTEDYEADTKIKGLTNFSTLSSTPANGTTPAMSGCDTTYSNGNGNGGQCLGALAAYMYNADLRSDIDDQQNVKSYFIGFGSDFATGGSLTTAFSYLDTAAMRGTGNQTGAFTASDVDDLTTTLTKIVTDVKGENFSFTAPTVAVNAFNRTQTLNELYVSVFQPTNTTHWPGNVKKYKLKAKSDGSSEIVDDGDHAAIDTSTDYFLDSAQSVWSASADGKVVTSGGAANKIPSPSTRNLYTYITGSGSTTLTATDNSFSTANTLITTTRLGIDGTSDPVRDKLINWSRGDADGSTTTTSDVRHVMGDPVHAQPGIVIYSGTASAPVGVIYQPTNDGYLHAIDTSTGEELWAFIPQESIGQLKDLYENEISGPKHYALDGSVRVYKYDADGDGLVESASGDKVYIYFSQGRAGSTYYALDVTDKNSPKFMWSKDSSNLSGLGQSWSRPTLAQVSISGASQNSKKLVLIFGGGYDSAKEDSTNYQTTDNFGNRIFMLDAVSGALLWSAGNTSANNLNLSRMDHAIPSDVSVIDLDGDGFADRMYVGDMAAQLWSFDIYNGKSASGTGTNALVTGGVIASLGTYSESPHTIANTRRFYYTPDVSYMRNTGGNPYFNIAIGSGYRGHPLNTTIHDRFYSIRQYSPFAKLTQAQYDALSIITESDLTDVTTTVNPSMNVNAKGWFMQLNQPNDSWVGEKVLAGATTYNGIIYFPTYTPSLTNSDSCIPKNTNRIYAVGIADAKPSWPSGTATGSGSSTSNGSSVLDRFQTTKLPGIASDVMVLFPAGQPSQCMDGTKMVACTSGASLTKSSWRDSAAQ